MKESRSYETRTLIATEDNFFNENFPRLIRHHREKKNAAKYFEMPHMLNGLG